MDPDITIMYFPQQRQITKKTLTVKLSKTFDRKKLPDNLEDIIEDVWQARLAVNPSLWNGSKFRLDSVTEDQFCANFNIGLTCYKDFIGTNWSPKAKLYHKLGEEHHCNSQAFMSDALGVGSIVHTADDKTVLIRRSINCGEAVGLWDIPGGHPEPKALVGNIPMDEIDLEKIKEQDVVNEIFNSTLLEIRDEINIPLATLSDPILIGIARNTTSAGRPSSEYYVRLTSKEIYELYMTGSQAEAGESVAIKILPISDVPNLQSSQPSLWNELAPSAKGCFTLYGMMIKQKLLSL